MREKNFCQDCGGPSLNHFNTWMEELSRHIFPSIKFPAKLESILDAMLEKFFHAAGIAQFDPGFTNSDIQLRSSCFIDEMKKQGASFYSLRSSFGFTNHFKMEIAGKTFRFETLPVAGFASKFPTRLVEDKQLAREHCKKGRFPVAEGGAFWFWQKNQAIEFASQIGFPVVVKPRAGSVARHVTTNIQTEAQLAKAIKHAALYSPAFIIEKFIPDAQVHRATVIDFDFVACVQQVPANVVGDGSLSIRQLIDKKNQSPNRGNPQQKQFTLYKIIEDETTKTLLSQKGYEPSSIPQKGEIVYLQHDPFLRLGGDLVEVTPDVHPDNLLLFRQIARFFDTRVTGIDFLAANISISWKNQPCAVLELNSVPCIELHHFPSSGRATNPAKALSDMFMKYYLR